LQKFPGEKPPDPRLEGTSINPFIGRQKATYKTVITITVKCLPKPSNVNVLKVNTYSHKLKTVYCLVNVQIFCEVFSVNATFKDIYRFSIDSTGR